MFLSVYHTMFRPEHVFNTTMFCHTMYQSHYGYDTTCFCQTMCLYIMCFTKCLEHVSVIPHACHTMCVTKCL